MNASGLLLALLFAGQIAPATTPRITRAELAAIEKSMDRRLEKASVTDPFDLLGTTRAIYLDGYGVVFTTELNLLVTGTLTPFHQSFTRQEIAKVHERKLLRLPVLKQHMREMLINAAANLENLPPSEQVVLSVSVFHYSWEDATGLPAQIVMQAQRQQLLSNETRETAIRTQEF